MNSAAHESAARSILFDRSQKLMLTDRPIANLDLWPIDLRLCAQMVVGPRRRPQRLCSTTVQNGWRFAEARLRPVV